MIHFQGLTKYRERERERERERAKNINRVINKLLKFYGKIHRTCVNGYFCK